MGQGGGENEVKVSAVLETHFSYRSLRERLRRVAPGESINETRNLLHATSPDQARVPPSAWTTRKNSHAVTVHLASAFSAISE